MNRGMKKLLMSGAMVLAAASARAEFIANGSFEGTLEPWNLLGYGGSDYEHATNFGFDGTSSIRFGYVAIFPTSLSQELFLQAGQKYHFSMWVYNNGIGDDYLNLKIYEGFDNAQTLLDGMVSTGLESWEEVSFDFTSTYDTQWMIFDAYDKTASFYIDQVSITLVPTPAGAALLAIGAIGFSRRRRA